MTISKLGKTLSQKKTDFQKLMAKNVPSFELMPKKFDAAKMAIGFNEDEVRKGEMPSANCHGSARGMAELAAAMANKGKKISNGDIEVDGDKATTLMSEDTWNKMHGAAKVAVDAFMPEGMSRIVMLSTEMRGLKENKDDFNLNCHSSLIFRAENKFYARGRLFI